LDRRKKLNRFLCCLLIFAMVMPIVSFATSDATTDTTTDTTTEGTDTGAVEEIELTDEQIKALFQDVKTEIQETATVDAKQEAIKDHTFVCENDKYELYLKESNLSILIRCKENGAIIESTADQNEMDYQLKLTPNLSDAWAEFFDSGIVLQLIEEKPKDRFSSVAQVTRKLGAKSADLTYTKNDNGFKCSVSYADYGISFDVEIKLTDDGVEYFIPGDSVKEGENKFYIQHLYAFPLMGKTMIDARDGYMILPDGNGITVDFVDNQRKYSSPWVSRIFGLYDDDIGLDNFEASNSIYTSATGRTYDTANDAEKVSMPIYGMVYEDTQAAVLCAIEDGAESAKLYGNMNGAQNHFWNYVAVQYEYRTIIAERTDSGENAATTSVMQDDRQIDDVKATFLIQTNDKADYAGLATAYRDFLLGNGGIIKQEYKYNTRIQVLGNDKENFLVFKRSVPMTTVAELEAIVNKLIELGASDLLVVYDGWQNGGVYDIPVTKYNVDSSIGSEGEMTDLYNSLKDKGINLVLNQDAMRINPDTNTSSFNVIKKIDKSTYTEYVYATVYDQFKVLYPEVSKENILKLANGFKSEGIATIGLSGVSDNLFAYSKKSVEYTRANTKAYFEQAMAELKAEGFFIALEAPYSYFWKYCDAFMNMPLGTSGYIYASNEIPFMSTVLKGVMPMYSEYVNFEANAVEFYLKLAETGVYPSFYITHQSPSKLSETNSDWIYSSEADAYYEEVAEYAAAFKELDDAVAGAVIEDHEIVGNVTITTYDNGVQIYVNYGQGVTVNDIYVEAESFQIVK